MPKETEVLQAIAEGVQTTGELCSRFPGLDKVRAAVILSRYLQKGVVIRHGTVADGKRGHPHIVYRLSKNGHDKLMNEEVRREIAELKAKELELKAKIRGLEERLK